MAKKKLTKQKKDKYGNLHIFLGGNYGMGCEVKDGTGYFQMTQLNSTKAFGARCTKKDYTDKVDTFVFMDKRTVDIMIGHLTYIRGYMRDKD